MSNPMERSPTSCSSSARGVPTQPLVLIVDDDEILRTLMAEALLAAGFRTTQAADGATARTKFSEEKPDVVLLDVRMPGEDGFATCTGLRTQSGGADVPILMITALEDMDSINRAYAVGATDFITKPVHLGLLPHRVCHLMRAANALAEVRAAAAWVMRGEALEKSLALARTIQDSVPDALLVLDDEHRVLGHNAHLRGLFDPENLRAAADPLTVVLAGLVDPDEMRACMAHLRDNPSMPSRHEVKLVGDRLAERHSAPVRRGHGPDYGRVWTFRDVTEQRKRDNDRLVLSDRLASIGRLTAGAAHEINNPLAYTIAALDCLSPMVADSGGDEAQLVADMRDGLERIRVIVKGLHGISRVPKHAMGPVRLDAVLDRAIDIASSQTRLRAEVVRQYRTELEAEGDPMQLGQVFLNLIMNAAQAIPVGNRDGNRIVLTLAEDGPDHIRVDVTDTGAGIAPENLERVFDPFFTTKAIGEGTGLGLSICRGIVDAHSGTIQIQSEVGHGTRTIVRLPRARRDAARPSEQEASPSITRRGHVVMIDDEPSLLRLTRRLLRRSHEVVGFTSMYDALPVLEREGADVVLCDLSMPDATGMDLYEAIAARLPHLLPRLVFLSGGVISARAYDFLASVATPFVEKPASTAELLRVIASVMSQPATATMPAHRLAPEPAPSPASR